jgi:hypothetical protein
MQLGARFGGRLSRPGPRWARPEYLRGQPRRHGGALLPAVTHDGIEDLFVETGSSVWYWHDGQWFRLTGAD